MAQKRLLFLADPPEHLKPAGDTSLALAQAALEGGYSVDWAAPSAVTLRGDTVCARPQWRLEGFEDRTNSAGLKVKEPLWSQEQATNWLPLEDYRLTFVRKDPPFDHAYLDFCWLLALAFPNHDAVRRFSQTRVTDATAVECINAPSGLLSFHEKTLQFAALACGALTPAEVMPAAVTHDETMLSGLLADWDLGEGEHGYIIKPWLGFGGRGVVKVKDSTAALVEWRERSREGLCIVQPFDPEVLRSGDLRILTAGQGIVGCFLRKPAPGRIESNLAQGGSAHRHELTERQRNTVNKLIPFLREHGIFFAGIDMIGERINEVNITSPTGLRNLQSLGDLTAPQRAFEALLANA